MPRVSEEQIKRAKEVDLLTYLQQNEPNELLPQRNGEYRTVTHGSLVISNGLWIRNRGKVGGKTALDYLIKVRGMGFVDAVEAVLGERGEGYGARSDVGSNNARSDVGSNNARVDVGGNKTRGDVGGNKTRGSADSFSLSVEETKSQTEPPQPKKWDFYPPRVERYSNKAVAYLQQRGISPDVINRVMADGTLYESRYYNPKSKHHNAAVCVFAGKDESGKMVYAALRGIDIDFKIDKAGSDKRYNFMLPANNPESRHLACFEAPIDLLSHATLQERGGWDFDVHRLSLGGTSSLALLSFLERNPHITRVMLHLDNDEAGLAAAESIKTELLSDSRFKSIHVSYNPPRHGAKDYNDVLLRVVEAEQEQKQQQKQKHKQQQKQQHKQSDRREAVV